MEVMNQLLLPLSTPPRFDFANMVCHTGVEEAIRIICSTYGKPIRPLPSLFIHGPAGTGKTHMLHALAALLETTFSAEKLTVTFVTAGGGPTDLESFEKLATEDDAAVTGVCGVTVDDVHLLDGEKSTHLWNLFNRLTRVGIPMVLASAVPPEEVFAHDPHVQSRITSGLVFRLDPPDDAIRMLILDKLAADRHVRIGPEVCRYLVTRKSRNVKELNRIFDTLDRVSLESKRRITLPFVKLLEAQGLL